MSQIRYDPNPDVHELLLYSGAGERMRKKKRAEEHASFSARVSEMSVRFHAQIEADERAERRSNWCFALGILGVVVAVIVLAFVTR